MALVIAPLVLLCGLACVVGGGVLLWADRDSNRTDGYLFSDLEAISSEGFAISSERIDLSTGADWLPISQTIGSARVEVTATGPSDVFVGIAPVAEAAAYLDGVQRTVVDDLGVSATTGQTLPGGAPPAPPGEQTFWTEQASGPGTQQLTWTPEEGDWMLVVMNADGAAGVAVQSRVGVTFPSLTGLAWGLLVGGAVAFLIAVLLLSLGVRRAPERRAPAEPPPPVRPAGRPPIPAPRSGSETPADSN